MALPPLELGFLELRSLDDVLGPLAADRIAASRKPAAVKAPASPVALPALKSSSSKVIIEEAAEPEPSKLPHAMIRLNNNSIADIAPLYRVLEVTLMDPAALVWIDLSHNSITEIGTAFKRLVNLKRLYLHANAISLLAEAEGLQGNRSLDVLTLHANPVQEKANYRQFVISTLPWLRALDTSTVTKRELDSAIAWRKMTKFITKRTGGGDEDE